MKSAMQELIEICNLEIDSISRAYKGIDEYMSPESEGKMKSFKRMKRVAVELLEKEKQQIIDAFNEGDERGHYVRSDEYYNQTFKQ